MSIIVKQLTKLFGSQKAVNNISFEAKPGEILGFLGPNGAGKSTTMKIATCYLPPTSGSVEVCGYEVSQQPIKVRELVGYLPEHNPLYLDMYVKEYLGFIASLHGITGKKSRERVAEMIAMVGLSREQNKQIGALSKGYRQRVGLAQALIHDPEVLILDEPTTGLDPNQLVEIRSVIKEVSKHKTLVFSTHIMQEVQALCDRVVIIHQGQIVANHPIAQLKALQQSVEVYMAFEGEITPETFANIAGVAEVKMHNAHSCTVVTQSHEDMRGQLFRASVKAGYVIVEMQKTDVSLEQVFQQLTQGQQQVLA